MLTSCIPGLDSTTKTVPTSSTTPSPIVATPIPQAEVTFQVELTKPLSADQGVGLEVLDEVTGLALNAVHSSLKSTGPQKYEIKLPVPVGSVVKYRYTRDGTQPGIEYTAQNQQVRYRLIQVNGPMAIKDLISAWNDTPYQGDSGRIQGQVTAAATSVPVPNALVTVAGASTLTASDGSFLIEGVPAGIHQLVVYASDGSFQTYQQGAQVAKESTTPAPIKVIPSSYVQVTFSLSSPEGTISGIPIRLIGNLSSLGNIYADLQGGMNTLAARAPLLILKENKYSLTLRLPVGYDLRYKYSLGDGFWNAEHSPNGQFRVRQLIVPNRDTLIEDKVDTWAIKGSAPVTFTLKVPENTPASDMISIQFNPYGWTEPIPMWPLGNNKWLYILYSPLNILGNVGYRYCRNDQCGIADDEATRGTKVHGYPFNNSPLAQEFQDEVKTWAWWQPVSGPTTIASTTIQARDASFWAGFELMPRFHPSYPAYQGNGLRNIKDIGANWVVLTPTWHYTRKNLPVLENVPGKDPSWADLSQSVTEAKDKQLSVAIYPQADTSLVGGTTWWESATRDSGWWQSWFDRYRTFLLHHADLANQNGAKALILGDSNILPALPGGKVGSAPSGVPDNAEELWRNMIKDVRAHYNGQLLWALPYPDSIDTPPRFLSDVDQIYLILQSSPAKQTLKDFEAELGKGLDTKVLPLRESVKRPVIVGVAIPSVDGLISGCVRTDAACVPWETFNQPVPEMNAVLNLQAQVDLYNSILSVINQRSWINGFVSRGYFSPVPLKDKSTSVQGKPAADVLWFWYPRLLGKTK